MAGAATVFGTLNRSPNFQQTNTTGLITSQTLSAQQQQSIQYINATAQALGVDQLFVASASLASTTATFRFSSAGTLKDMFGGAIAMVRIREIIVFNLNQTVGQDLEVYSSASDGIPWIPPVANPLYARSGTTNSNTGFTFGSLQISDPCSFGAGVGNIITTTTDSLTLNSGSNTVAYSMIVLGCSVL